MADQATELHPTKTRIGLLKAAAQDEVYRSRRDQQDYQEMPGQRVDLKVTARVDELQRAGWIELGPKVHAAGQAWRATEQKGYPLLDEHVPGWAEPC